jgi:hypothetical protein
MIPARRTSDRPAVAGGATLRASGDAPKWVAVATTSGLSAAAKLGWGFLKVKKRAQGADAVFRGQLRAAGMGPEQTDELSSAYLSSVRLRRLVGPALRGWRARGADRGQAV